MHSSNPTTIDVNNNNAKVIGADEEEERDNSEKVSTPMAAAIKSAYCYKRSLHHQTQSNSSNDDVAFGVVGDDEQQHQQQRRDESQEVGSELSTTSTATGSSNSSTIGGTQKGHQSTNTSAASIANRLNTLQDYDEKKVAGLSRTLSVQTLPLINSPPERDYPEARPKTSISLNASIPFDEIPIKTRYSSSLSLAPTNLESDHQLSHNDSDEVDDHQSSMEKSVSAFELQEGLDDSRFSQSVTPHINKVPRYRSEPLRPLQRNGTEFVKTSPKSFLKRGNRKIFPSKVPTLTHKMASNHVSPKKALPFKEYASGAALAHFERPKEAFATCMAQLEDSNWETVMIGLKNFNRLIRNHPEYIDPHIHVIAAILSKHVRNLRSQVSRAACQATNEFFLTHHKQLETEADDLVTTLLSRTADTNKFLRKDATKALESMCDNLSNQKVIQLLSTRGVSHQNALVRTTTSYLLCRLVLNWGSDKVYAMSKDSRDRIFLTGAQLLSEGSLETRNYAKQVFRELSTNIKYQKALLEVIPHKLYRNIEKSLKKVQK